MECDIFPFSVLTLLVGRQEGIWPVKNECWYFGDYVCCSFARLKSSSQRHRHLHHHHHLSFSILTLFSRWTWVSQCLLKQRMMEVVSGDNWTTGAISRAKLQSNHQYHPVFLQAGCPSCRLTNSVKALKGKISHSMDLLTPSSHGVFQLCLWPLIAPGYLGGGLPCLSSALWCQYPSPSSLVAVKSKMVWHSGTGLPSLSWKLVIKWVKHLLPVPGLVVIMISVCMSTG